MKRPILLAATILLSSAMAQSASAANGFQKIRDCFGQPLACPRKIWKALIGGSTPETVISLPSESPKEPPLVPALPALPRPAPPSDVSFGPAPAMATTPPTSSPTDLVAVSPAPAPSPPEPDPAPAHEPAPKT